ncbi:anthranilate synthase component I family protein [Haloparvum sedimenti]|uniref:anthranilate synthase component I family protein n=1 Tax=Haloparvum sedimenti TaxID=1678448 RepID=UPI00071E9A71|nr:anthranilate synthase component I family protein [Haloparvum sedimenti]
MTHTVRTDRAAFRETAAAAPSGARVPVEVRTTVADPFDAYRRARDGPGGAFLETTGGQTGWGYFGVDPVERLRVGPDAVVRESDPDAGTGDYRRDSPTLAALDGLLADEDLARGDCEVPFPCGVLGWLSYDAARELETFPEDGTVDDRGLPRLDAAMFDRLAAWECPTPEGGPVTLRITVCPRVSGGATDCDGVYDEAVARAVDLVDRIETGGPEAGPAPEPDAENATFRSESGREPYADAVRRVKAHVREGDTFQANVSQRLVAPAAVHPVDAYDALREVNPAPYSGLLEFARPRAGENDGRGAADSGVDLVSASPELLLDREGDRLATEPIAGTRPRGGTSEADAALEAELTGDEKERAEHAMLVDLERNDLGKVCEFGSVDVTEYRRVDRYSEVMHLVSLVEGRARPDATLADAVAACFPGGTITGAPKPRTMEIIDELEPTRRGPYTGSMGIFGLDGRATLNIIIRTLVRHADEYHLRVGAGIVHDSDPDAEYEETLAKGRALVTAIDEALAAADLRVDAAGETDDAVGSGKARGDQEASDD